MRNFIFIVIAILSFSFTAEAQDPIWINNHAPEDYRGPVIPFGMHKISSVPGKGRGMSAIQWLMYNKGDSSFYSVIDTTKEGHQILIKSPLGENVKYEVKSNPSFSSLIYTPREEGFYNIYVIRETEQNGIKIIDIAKGERLNHQCRNGHSYVQKRLQPNYYPDEVPFELIRLRNKNENFHFFVKTTEEVKFKAFLHGKPAGECQITIISGKGWKKNIVSDKNGEFTFKLPSDNVSPISEFKKDERLTYTVMAEVQSIKASDNSETIYRTSYTDDYIPTEALYKSGPYAWILLGTLLFISFIFVVILRKQKKNQYVAP